MGYVSTRGSMACGATDAVIMRERIIHTFAVTWHTGVSNLYSVNIPLISKIFVFGSDLRFLSFGSLRKTAGFINLFMWKRSGFIDLKLGFFSFSADYFHGHFFHVSLLMKFHSLYHILHVIYPLAVLVQERINYL